MMRLVACASLLLVAAFAAVEGTDKQLMQADGHQNYMVERLGHFNQLPFTDLYKTYAAAFILPNNPDRSKDDYRNYLPSGQECMIFFKDFRINQYKLHDLDQFILLDACLGYLYRNEHQSYDKDTVQQVKDYLEPLKADEELRRLWEGTQIEEANEQAKECVADLLLNVVVAKHQFPSVVCNNHFLQVFLQFAECQQDAISEEQRNEDSYLKYLYNLLKERVGICVEYEIGHIEEAVRLAYAKKTVRRYVNKIKSPFSNLAKQANQRMWPREVMTLLTAFQNTTDEVNQREVHQLIRGVIVEDQKLEQRLLDHMSYYADKVIAPEANNKAARSDPTGTNRYAQLVDSLCNYFRSSDQESKYDFATPIIRLVQLLAHQDLFGISQRDFVTKMLTQAKESSPVYLSVQACNILTFTEGAIALPAHNTKQHYKVVFRADRKGMVLWPDAGYF